MKLSARIRCGFDSEPFAGRVERLDDGAWIIRNLTSSALDRVQLRWAHDSNGSPDFEGVELPNELRYVSEGDILRLNPHAEETRVLYRKNSQHNVLFFTERCNNRRLKIRLYGIDAPELKQPFGREAREALAALVLYREVSVGIKSRDRYGRSIAVATVGPINVNEYQIATGMSWWYQAYARSDNRLRSLSAIARQSRVGL